MSLKHPWQQRYSTFATNTSSKFEPFTLRLANNATLTGISYIPSGGLFYHSPHKPLLIGIHGATCSAFAWDVSRKVTASLYAELLGIPFVAFNRPNFLGSSGWLVDDDTEASTPRFEIPEGSSYFPEEARWYVEYIFPLLWTTFGIPNNCKAIVTNSHSMAVPITIIAAGLYSQDAKFPWAGMVISGFGEEPLQVNQIAVAKWSENHWDPADLPLGHDPSIHIGPYLKADKVALMLGPPNCCEPELGDLCWKQNTPLFLGEVIDMSGAWVEKKEAYKAAVRIPVLYGLGSMDWLWKSTPQNVDSFLKGFVNVPRVEGARVENAPHAIEWSRMGAGWSTRVFGWAQEVTVSMGMKELGLERYT